MPVPRAFSGAWDSGTVTGECDAHTADPRRQRGVRSAGRVRCSRIRARGRLGPQWAGRPVLLRPRRPVSRPSNARRAQRRASVPRSGSSPAVVRIRCGGAVDRRGSSRRGLGGHLLRKPIPGRYCSSRRRADVEYAAASSRRHRVRMRASPCRGRSRWPLPQRRPLHSSRRPRRSPAEVVGRQHAHCRPPGGRSGCARRRRR